MDDRNWISWWQSNIALSHSNSTDILAHQASYIGQWKI